MDLESELYFVAWFKNDQPQDLMGGPFVSLCQADAFIAAGRTDRHRLGVVALGPLQFSTTTKPTPT